MSSGMTQPEDERRDVLIDDHNYDGIQEYDNPLPKWWTWMFIGSFVFSIGYVAHYMLGNGEGIHDDYLSEVKAFEQAEEKRLMAMGEVSEDVLGQMAANSSSVAKGRETYVSVCTQCHAENGEGKIGPNLTDAAWIHGDGSLMAIYKTVSEGVLAKGMPAWGKQLSPTDLRSVVAYVGSIRNTNVPGKEPQGQVPGDAEAKDVPTGDAADDEKAPADEKAPVNEGEPARDPSPRGEGADGDPGQAVPTAGADPAPPEDGDI